MSLSEWWIDDDIGIDAAGNLYATWDTQGTNADGSANDIGWLSFSTNHGQSWSAPVQAPADQADAPHIMAVVGGAAGTAYVSWLASSDPRGYALYLRAFSDQERLALGAAADLDRVRRHERVAGRHDGDLAALAEARSR